MPKPDKLKMHSPDLTQENIARIRELFPNCVTEARDEKTGELRLKVDFDLLRQELSDELVEGPTERYRLDWPGKRAALLAANAPIAKTLRPCREESVNFDTTRNLFIEGDNLDALKLLQEAYLGKVKMIYIDPPYNTGKDFVYRDNFAEKAEDYLRRSNQKDEEGGRLTTNSESNGRFHSDWLSMMYPRLKLARNLLQDDGIIFVSIDENEEYNLNKICNEIFGEKNYICTFIWRKKKGGGNDSKYCAVEHEYILAYAKNINSLKNMYEMYDKKYLKRYNEVDEYGRYYWDTFKRKSGKQYYKIVCPDGTILEKDEYGNPISWLRSEKRFKLDLEKGEIRFVKSGDGWSVQFKQRLPEGKKPRSILYDKWTTSDGSKEVFELFKTHVFSNPKPVGLLKYLVGLISKKEDIILDFFTGSATTAHAVMQLNAEDGGNRRFIMVQLPEPTPEGSEARKAGFETIADIAKKRIRRAGKKILEGECHPNWNKDVGFRVLKVDTSNMKDVYYFPKDIDQARLDELVDNIKPDRTAEDLLFQVLIDWAVEPTLPIERREIQGKEVFFVNEEPYDLIACFDTGITEELVKELAAYKPLRVVFRDSGLADDALKTNTEQIFRQLSPSTDVKVI